MKNFLKKLHIVSNQSEDGEGSASSRSNKSIEGLSHSFDMSLHPRSNNNEQKPLSGLSNWLNSVANRNCPSDSSSSNVTAEERMEQSDVVSNTGLDVVSDTVRHGSGTSISRDPGVEEEYQIQLALELSAREDPEAVQIEAVKQISLGTCTPDKTPAEVVAYRYWNYNSLSYDDKILDGFYDLYGILNEGSLDRMPSLVDLQGTPMSGNIAWEAVLVNRAADANLLKLEEVALKMSLKSGSDYLAFVNSNLVRELAVLVADYMGGPVGDPESMTKAWRSLTSNLKATLGSMVLPLGSLTIGLARHRALLFKVLADSVGIPCRLVKGQQYTGSIDVAMNFVKVDGEREYIVDLMADPGTLIPSDAAGSHIEYDELSRDIDSSYVASSSSGVGSSFEEHSESGTFDNKCRSRNPVSAGRESDDRDESFSSRNLSIPIGVEEGPKLLSDDSRKSSNAEKFVMRGHARSPSWTEGISSPAVRRMKVKDVSKYMIDAAKDNPQLAQKLHDVLLESGVVAPPNLFTEIYAEQLDPLTAEAKSPIEHKEQNSRASERQETMCEASINPARYLPPLPPQRLYSKACPPCPIDHLNSVEGLRFSLYDGQEMGQLFSAQTEETPVKYARKVPVAAAAAAAAAVVASSMVVVAAKSNHDSNFELPVAAAATATAAAVVATTAAVSKQYEHGTSDVVTNIVMCEPQDSGNHEQSASSTNSDCERISDRLAGYDITRSDVAIDDATDYEIPWEDITLGERIGLGAYGEVYHGEWHGTEVAIKKFLDQDIFSESLEEFKSEVRIMKRVRHPNVVLFMGAVTRAPNLSIITEFLPRGSLYRLIHRPNNQLDERRRLRMALDAARGMNYLHTCSPVIVHRDLKTPNLLVDKNWVVKVCDFGLSRIKHSTFLSSRSTAGTAEWMAPEVLRNEPSNEKCDVYSFGVILWELSTMQQPWMGMNSMQVVGAVGFQHRRLDIPEHVDPAVADIIRKCWQTDPKLRPTFAEVMAALKPLQKPVNSSQVPRPHTATGNSREKLRSSQVVTEELDN